MNTTRLKKLLILNTPYVVIGLYATKLGEAWRLAEGTDASNKFLHLMDGLSAAFRSPFPSLYPADLLIGIVVGCLLRLAVYEKGRNAKKYRHNVEYGSARWGTHSDIAPFIDPDPWNNVILTKTESLTMNSRPKAPRNARNRNVLVVGGSGSGKTRFFIKPNIMQCTKTKGTSLVVTDPKGTLVVECGKMLVAAGYELRILKLDLPQIREMIRLLSNMTNNLNQIAKRMNAHGQIYETEIDEIIQKQDELWKMINRLLTVLERTA